VKCGENGDAPAVTLARERGGDVGKAEENGYAKWFIHTIKED
jgi:hypothetical protein